MSASPRYTFFTIEVGREYSLRTKAARQQASSHQRKADVKALAKSRRKTAIAAREMKVANSGMTMWSGGLWTPQRFIVMFVAALQACQICEEAGCWRAQVDAHIVTVEPCMMLRYRPGPARSAVRCRICRRHLLALRRMSNSRLRWSDRRAMWATRSAVSGHLSLLDSQSVVDTRLTAQGGNSAIAEARDGACAMAKGSSTWRYASKNRTFFILSTQK